MENKFLKIVDKKEWQNLLSKVLFKTFFHNLEWEEFLEKQFNWLKFERYIYKNDCLLSLARVDKKLISHPFCEYGGPLPLVEKIDGLAFQKDLFEEFKIPLKISFHPKLLDYFKGYDDNQSQRETYLLEQIQSLNPENIGDRNRRRAVKTAQESGLTCQKCEKIDDLKTLYNFYVKSLKKHRALVYPFSFFEFFFQNPNAEILLVKKEKKIVGGNIFLFYDKIIHSFLCGFDEKYRKLGAHSLVLWLEFRRKQKEGFKAFDFGATKKSSSLSNFKSRWGAKPYPVFELKNYTGSPRLKDSFLRDVWSYLPSFLIKKLSPHLLKYKL